MNRKGKKQGFFGDECEEPDPMMYFNSQSLFRPEKEMLTSVSPSQLSGFGSSIYSQPTASLPLPQRSISNAPFQKNLPPTSASSFPLALQQQPPQQQVSPNRNLFPMSRGLFGQFPNQSSVSSQMKRPNPSSSLMSSSGASSLSMSAFSRLPGGDGNQTNIDLADFPTLGNRSSMPNPLPSARNYVGMVSKPVSEPAPEFHIHQEDFPALPGATNPPTSSAADTVLKSQSILGVAGAYDQALKENAAKPTSSQQKRGIHSHPDGTISNIPAGMVVDQFGMVGLLTFIRAADTDINLVALAPGIDLTTLGLNLNSPENLYSTFQSPWADAPCRSQDIDFHVPTEYLTNIYIRDKLAPIKLNRYGEDMLFFMFYMNGGDVLQLASAAELYNRDWRYHKEERAWITRISSMEAVVKTSTYERGTYYFFDAHNWRKVSKEFHLEYDKLEERPHLPQSIYPAAAATNSGVQPNSVLAH